MSFHRGWNLRKRWKLLKKALLGRNLDEATPASTLPVPTPFPHGLECDVSARKPAETSNKSHEDSKSTVMAIEHENIIVESRQHHHAQNSMSTHARNNSQTLKELEWPGQNRNPARHKGKPEGRKHINIKVPGPNGAKRAVWLWVLLDTGAKYNFIYQSTYENLRYGEFFHYESPWYVDSLAGRAYVIGWQNLYFSFKGHTNIHQGLFHIIEDSPDQARPNFDVLLGLQSLQEERLIVLSPKMGEVYYAEVSQISRSITE